MLVIYKCRMFYEGKYFSKTIDNIRKFIHFTYFHLAIIFQLMNNVFIESNAYDMCDQFIVLHNQCWTSCSFYIEKLLVSSLLMETCQKIAICTFAKMTVRNSIANWISSVLDTLGIKYLKDDFGGKFVE